jgi:RNA binding exosome subunit
LHFRELVAEAFVHATESPEAVELALRLFVRGAPVERSEIGGHFGQALAHLKASVKDPGAVAQAVALIQAAVGPEVGRTAGKRMGRDLSLNIRFDKQAALQGELRLETRPETDVVKVRLRLRAPGLRAEAAAALIQQDFLAGFGEEEE